MTQNGPGRMVGTRGTLVPGGVNRTETGPPHTSTGLGYRFVRDSL